MGNPTKKTFEFKAIKDFACPMGDVLLELVDQITPSNPLPVKIIIGKEKQMGKYPLYLDIEGENNLAARLSEVMDGMDALDDADIEALLQSDFSINVVRRKNNEIFGSIHIRKVVSGVTDGVNVSEVARKAMEKAVAKGYVKKDVAEARLKYMKENYCDDLLIANVFNDYTPCKISVDTPRTMYFDPYLEDKRKLREEGMIATGLRMLVERIPCILEGEKSTGKNVYAETLCWLTNDDMELITPNRQMSPAAIFGDKSTDNSAAYELAEFDTSLLVKKESVEEKRRFMMNMGARQGWSAEDTEDFIQLNLSKEDKEILEKCAAFEKAKARAAAVNIKMDESALVRWLENGGVLILNEFNLMDPNLASSVFNQIADGTGFIFIPGRGRVDVHKDCKLLATQNAGYVGVEDQNEATLSRFACIQFQPPKTIKGQLVNAVTARLTADGYKSAKAHNNLYKQTESFYKLCQKAVNQQTISNSVLNIRGLVRAIVMVIKSDGHSSLRTQITLQVINTCPADERLQLMTYLEQTVPL